MKILVVDDFSTMRRIVRNLLVELGFSNPLIQEADDGNNALTMLKSQPFDLVVTDWNMPNMTGTEFAKALRDRGEQVPILMVTARSVREDIIEAMEAGVNNYIVKPFTPQILKEKIDALLAVAAAA